ncbi:MAG: GNAT family N-acetyltransferase [Planctomycetia bacterium]|nr:GNAT family N-acetyltransferase [Planctomycetia bacterium]
MQLEIIRCDAGFASLREDWNRLAGEDPLNGWEWSYAWWHEFRRGGRLALGVVREAGTIVAIAPFYLVRRSVQGHVLQFLGSGKACTDYRRILLGPTDDANHIDAIVAALLDPAAWKAAGIGPIDLWELEGIDIGEPSLKSLVAGLKKQGFAISTDELESSWTTSLPGSWNEFVASTHRTIRRKIHKARRRSEDPEIAFHSAAQPDEIAAIWDDFVRLHQSRFQEKVVGGGCFTDPTFERFLRSAVDRIAPLGNVRLMWCTQRGVPISIQMYLLGRETAYMYQSGFDPAFAHLEPGHLLYSFTVDQLIASGFATLDFLRGDESYKADWNGRPVPLARLRCVSPRTVSRIRDTAFVAARNLSRAWRGYRAKAGTSQPIRNQRAPSSTTGDSAQPLATKELVEV